MIGKITEKSRAFLTSKQNTILSAASVITVMIVLSQFFGLIRQWIILKYLGQEGFSLYMAAFRLPDLVFEVFAFGAFSSAFIPVFSIYLKKDKKKAWDIASRVTNIGLLIFLICSLIFSLFSYQFYSLIAYGFDEAQTLLVSRVAKLIFLAEGFFIVSYIITGVLESSRRFLVPALAPVFYNLGIILGTVLFADTMGIFAPALGVVIGAFAHLGIQLPVAYKLGFRFSTRFKPNKGVREIGKLAAPRLLDLGFLQVQKSAELFFASIMSTASYAYLSLGTSLQAIPIMLFGVSLSKAALVSLSHQKDPEKFRYTFMNTLNQMMFLIIPIAAFIIVLRIPLVRLTYGTSQSLDWAATVQIGLVLSSFALGIPFQAALSLISRAFYARHDTKTPVMISVIDVILTLILEAVFVFVLGWPVWSIALANTIACAVQVIVLYIILAKKIGNGHFISLGPTFRALFFALGASSLMYLTLKFFDRSNWVKSLSFVGSVVGRDLPFEKFVLDTRYTFNLIILTLMVGLLGLSIYLLLSFIFKSQELFALIRLFTRDRIPLPGSKKESVTAMETDGEI
jgi:putative peptidoglycan lipid II flippase